ncbi:MAG: NAD(P)H-binding protein [Eubacteriales bacterium]|nr:NAD(P)H-binding protein [Eubacteriales bacterium]
MERVLITGLTGRSGAYFLQQLAAQPPEGMCFAAIVRPSSDTRALKECGLPIELRTGNLYDEAFVREATRGTDTLLHIAGTRKSWPLVRAAVENGAKRLILVHTTGIFSKYQSAKADYLEIERKIRELIAGRGVALTILRPTMIYGSANDGTIARFFGMARRLPVFPLIGGGRYALQPVHQSDLGRAYYQALVHPKETAGRDYNLSGGTKIDFADLMREICAVMGKKRLFVPVPLALAHTAAKLLRACSGGRVDYREKVLRMAEDRSFSHEQAAADFGYAPMELREGLRLEAEALRRAGKI